MLRKFWTLISLLLIAAMALSACKTTTPTEEVVPTEEIVPVTVTLWHTYGTGSAEEIEMTKIIAAANTALAAKGITVEVLQIPFSDIFTKYETDVAAGGGPDMFIAPNDNLGGEVRAGLIADITELAAGKLGDYGQLSIDGMSYEGKLYGIPESLKAVVLWYNKEMLATPPATTDELLALANSDTPIGVSIGCYHHWGFYYAFGGKIFDDNWKFIADQGGVADAFAWLKELRGVLIEKGLPKSDGDSLAPFQEGKIAMLTNGNWAMGDYKTALGDKLAVAPLPAGPGGKAAPLLGVDGYYFNPNSQNKAAALEVALYLTNVASQTTMMAAGHVPANTKVTITDPLLLGLSEAFKTAMVRPQVAALGNYWGNFCGDTELFETDLSPVDFVKTATENANK